MSVAIIAASSLSSTAHAQKPEARPPIFQKLIDCRKVVEDAARLACFDGQVGALEQAERERQVMIVDRAEVRKARRSLFGFALPKLTIFGGDEDKKEEEFTKLDTVVKSSRQLGDGRWAFVIEDGARWVQTDSRPLARDPRAGDKISIRKAAMGSFFANVDGQIAIRVRREN